jgi:hypothetical protein
LIDGIEGRREDVLNLPSMGEGSVAIHPNVFMMCSIWSRYARGKCAKSREGSASSWNGSTIFIEPR